MTKNYWTARASDLAEAYICHAGSPIRAVRFELVTRALLSHLPSTPQRVLDIGGGYGRQAVMLAHAGHSVIVVDPDGAMLAAAEQLLQEEALEVRRRITLVQGYGERAESLVGAEFDLVCCHSVLMYLDDPEPMLSSLARLVRPGGLLSILSLNAAATAMRSGLQGNWHETMAILETGTFAGARYAPSREHRREEVVSILEGLGVAAIEWYGVGVFTDHRTEDPVPEELLHMCEAEWLAGTRDPYRAVARSFHIVARRVNGSL